MQICEDGFPCPLCGNKDRFDRLVEPRIWIGEPHFTPLRGKIAVSRCGACGMELTRPRPTEDMLNGFYSAPGYGCHTVEGASDPGFLLRMVKQPVERSWLDFGCGSGKFLAEARASGFDARGIEIGALARENLIASGFQVYADIEECRRSGFRPGVVSMETVLEHVADPVAVLQGLRQIMAPGGTLAIVVPNVRSLRARLGVFVSPERYPGAQKHLAFPIHLVYYTASHLRYLAEKCGFRVEEQGSAGLGLDAFEAAPGQNCGSTQPAETPAAPGPKRFQFARNLVKGTVSRLQLGEHLYLIAKA